MRLLGLLFLSGCTLLTDPDSFEGTGSDAGRDAAQDAVTDTATDGPESDTGTDAPMEPCCDLGSCITTPVATFSQTQMVLDERGGELATAHPFRKVRLVHTDSGLALIRRTRGLEPNYQVQPIPPGGGTQTITQWLRGQFTSTDCLGDPVAEDPVVDIDVRRHGGMLAATVVRPGPGTGFKVIHLDAECQVYDVQGVPEGFASAGIAHAYTRAKATIALPAAPPNLVFRDAAEFAYDEVLGIDAVGPLGLVLSVGGAGSTVEYWVDGVPQAPQATAEHSAPPRLAAGLPQQFIAVYGVENLLEIEQVDLRAPTINSVVELVDPPGLGSELGVAVLDPERGLVLVAATNSPNSADMTLYLVDTADGRVFMVDSQTGDGPITGVDLVVDLSAMPPLITYAVESRATRAWQLRVCPPA